jgi:hypothetical protein
VNSSGTEPQSAEWRHFISKGGTRKIRFDKSKTSPHRRVEEFANGKWVKPEPLYPNQGAIVDLWKKV